MSSLTLSGIIFASICAGILLGMVLRAKLAEDHLSSDTKDVVKLGMGLLGTMTALVLGLLIASAKGSYDTQRNGLAQLAGNVIFLDRTLARYGKESSELRAQLAASVADMLQRTWPNENPQSGQTDAPSGTEGRYEGIFDRIQELTPKSEAQRQLQAQALKTTTDIAQARWILSAQKGRSIPTPFLVVMACWLTLILASFSMFAPRNVLALATLLTCALAVSSAIFLILELDQPFTGMIRIPSASLRSALEMLGR